LVTSPLFAALASAKAAEAAAKELKRLGLPGPPRGWDGPHKFMWFQLSPELKKYTTDREDARDRALRKAQNKLAELRKEFKNEEPTTAAGTDRIDAA
jgi:hypothetical protein